ncbi:unnamed protein product [Didymodactylos carnosus]|nr:unnamed protein product [Didymodactylos carnosus]CAF4154335.1 unnamed protein product [Didymodactylos carnosus]
MINGQIQHYTDQFLTKYPASLLTEDDPLSYVFQQHEERLTKLKRDMETTSGLISSNKSMEDDIIFPFIERSIDIASARNQGRWLLFE